MRAAVLIALAAILAFASADCSKKGSNGAQTGANKSSEAGKVLVKVNGTNITQQDLDQQEKIIMQQVQGRADSAQIASMMPTIRKQAAENAVNRVLIEQTLKKLGITAPKDQVDTRMDYYRKNFVSEDAFLNDLTKKGLDKESLRHEIEIGLEAEDLFNKRTAALKPPTDEQIKAYYDGNPDRFQQPAQVKVSHILIAVDKAATPAQKAEKKQTAVKVLAELKKGADFAEEAKKYSDDPGNKDKGGDLGFISKGQTVPEFEKVAFTLKKGALSGVVETSYGFHILKVTDQKKAEKIALDQAKQNISMYLTDQQKNENLMAYFDSLRAASKIQYVDTSLAH
jgi:parvulin-like peptidyl-prolyl isomerase